MNAEETVNELMVKWEYLVPATLQKQYGNVDQFAKGRQLEKDDLMQFGRLGLWEGIKSWQENPIGQERSFLIRNIRWYLGKMLAREQARHLYYKTTSKKYADKNYIPVVTSMSKTFDEESKTDFYDIISCDNIANFQNGNSIESKILDDELMDELYNILNDTELEIVFWRLGGLTYQQIGEKLNVSKQAIDVKMQKVQSKIIKQRVRSQHVSRRII